MKPTKRIFAAALAALIVAGAGTTLATQVPQLTNSVAHATETTTPMSGTCGENVTYELKQNNDDSENPTYILTISGTGAMEDYNIDNNKAPWYSYKDKITTVVIEDDVTSIGNFAFLECTGLTSATIPDNVISIGDGAFSNCSKLESINIPDSVTSIGISAFYGCSKLESINIPKNITSIENGTFYGCKALTSVTIPAKVTKIGEGAFKNCSSLQAVTFAEESKLETIGKEAFYSCTELTSITIPSSVKTIDYSAFYGCLQLKEVNFAENSQLQEIKGYAFSYCVALKSITLPESVTMIGYNPLRYCDVVCIAADGKNKETQTSALKRDGSYDNAILYYTVAENKVTITGVGGLIGEGEIVTIPNTIEGKPVTDIGTLVFNEGTYADNLKGVGIPASVNTIGANAFSDCTNLKVVIAKGSTPPVMEENTFGNDYTTFVSSNNIGAYTDADWKNVTDTIKGVEADEEENKVAWTLKNGVLTVSPSEEGKSTPMPEFSEPPEWYDYEEEITKLVIEDGIITIGDEVFNRYTNLKEVTIGGTVESIGYGAFWNCTGLESITIPKNIQSIGLQAFGSCLNLKTVTMESDTPPKISPIAFGMGVTDSDDDMNFESRCKFVKDIDLGIATADEGIFVPDGAKAAYTNAELANESMDAELYLSLRWWVVDFESEGVAVKAYKNYIKESTAGTTPSAPSTPAAPSEITVTKPTTKDEDGNTVEGSTTTKPDGSVTDTTIVTKPNGDTTKTVVGKDPQGNTTKTTVTKVETTADGTKTETETITEADKTPVTTKTTTKKDGSQTVEKTTSAENSRGNMVQTTETVVKDSDGNVVEKTTQKEIKNIGSQTDAVIDVDNNTATINKTGATKSNGVQATLTNKVVSQLKEANDGKNLTLTMNVQDKDGNDRYSVEVNTADLAAKNKLYLYKKDSKTGELLLVNSKAYKTDSKGQLKLVIRSKGDFVLKNAEDAAKINQQILDSVKAKKNKVTLSKSKTATFAFSDELDLRNVKSVTYTSSKPSVATVNANGKIKGKKAGTTTITATITLKNGETKTLTMKVTVK